MWNEIKRWLGKRKDDQRKAQEVLELLSPREHLRCTLCNFPLYLCVGGLNSLGVCVWCWESWERVSGMTGGRSPSYGSRPGKPEKSSASSTSSPPATSASDAAS